MTTTEAHGGLKLRQGDKVAIVAGSGRLPIDLAEKLAARGYAPFLVMVNGEADEGLATYDHEKVELENFAGLGPLLKRNGATHAVFAGGISRRPKLSKLRLSLALFRLMPRILANMTKGDDGVLRTLVGMMESQGIQVIGPHEVAPDLLASHGSMTEASPLKSDWRDLDAAAEAARAVGVLDIGQGAVAIGGRTIALEGIEGTDGLLERVKAMRGHGRIAGKKRGVLVKFAKPGQELRMDLPTIGPATVIAAHEAGLAGIGVEADRSLVLDAKNVFGEANRRGLFVVGLPPGKRL
ncbi:MAG: UDP-2,3-diacylglucosamine diphosphatase LpxI [Mesorhizobium sp.]|nr:UDP-2,3-diacylglucosamine diphosphatase LpxI [Mesorhizobium sp.]MBL8579626.1 UDP-2,3-diacylglucosamine diphosphatase LpxI [Mesorhizobium sp.]